MQEMSGRYCPKITPHGLENATLTYAPLDRYQSSHVLARCLRLPKTNWTRSSSVSSQMSGLRESFDRTFLGNLSDQAGIVRERDWSTAGLGEGTTHISFFTPFGYTPGFIVLV